MDGGASNAKRPAPAAAADGEADPDHLSRSSIASRAAEFPAEEALEEQETEGIPEELDYEEEVVIVKRPVRQRNSASYQASVRQEVAPSPSGSGYPGSPLFWVGVGVALAVAGSWIAGRVKQRGQDALMATLMKGLASGAGNGGQPGFPMGGAGPNPFGTAPSPFNFPGMPPMPPPTAKPQTPSATVTDTTATPVQPAPKPKQPETKAAQPSAAAKEEKSTAKPKRASFSDVKEEDLKQEEQKIKREPKRENIKEAEVINEGTSTSGGASFGSGSGPSGSNMTVDMLERMLDDPTIQQMVYPHLPEEMRNPETFKWMMQHPMYRQQMEEMLTNIGGNEQLIKGLDINSPEVKEQFDKMGMTPEQVVGKILSTPDVAQAFQNPRVQAAIMDVTANPMNIIKYQNDQEIMGIFDKISTLFPGMP